MAQATNQIAAAGALLTRSDHLYRSVQRTLAATAGHARLPKSVWVTDAGLWQAGPVATQVDLMATSPTLAASHYLLLRTVRLNPPVLPTPQGAPATVSALSPTSQIGVTTVLGNDGTVDEPHAAVRFTLANQATGATEPRSSRPPGLRGLDHAPDRDLPRQARDRLRAHGRGDPAGGPGRDGRTVLQQALQVAPAT